MQLTFCSKVYVSFYLVVRVLHSLVLAIESGCGRPVEFVVAEAAHLSYK